MGTEWPEKPKRSESGLTDAGGTSKRKRSDAGVPGMTEAQRRKIIESQAAQQVEQFAGFVSHQSGLIPVVTRNLIGGIIAVTLFAMAVFFGLVVGRGPCMGIGTVVCFVSIPALIIGGGFYWWWMSKRHFTPVEFTLSAYEVRRGDTLRVQYRQGVRSSITIPQYALRLVLRETVRYTRGTDTVTEHYEHVVARFDYPERTLASGDLLAEDVAFEIPAGAMHSFDQPNNKLRWYVVAEVGLAVWPHSVKNDIEFTVLAEGRQA